MSAIRNWLFNKNYSPEQPQRQKLNPSQPDIADGTKSSTTPKYEFQRAYEKIEVVNRGVNMIVNDASSVKYDVKTEMAVEGRVNTSLKHRGVKRLLTEAPNPYQDISRFMRDCITDYILDGNIFIYFDGLYMYHLPATKVTVEPSPVTFVKGYVFAGKKDKTYTSDEIIHIKDNSLDSVFRGTSRLRSAETAINLVHNMRNFQNNFFRNGAIPGLVIKSPNTLSQRIKERLISSWQSSFSPNSGGRRPLILDGGLEVENLSDVDFHELDFNNSLDVQEKAILKALGIPPILLETGNNSNVRPNLRLYYIETILPILDHIARAFERYFGFKVCPNLADVLALQPELRDSANYYTSLVNGGVLTPNEARESIGYDKLNDPELDEIRVPANVAGSAANPDEGGRPEGDNPDDEN